MKFYRSNIAFIHDVVMAAISFVLALFLRIAENIEFYPVDQLVMATIIFTFVAAIVFRSAIFGNNQKRRQQKCGPG